MGHHLHLAQRFAVTAETITQFQRPKRVGRTHAVTATIERTDGRDIFTSAMIVRPDGVSCATAQARFSGLDSQQSRERHRRDGQSR